MNKKYFVLCLLLLFVSAFVKAESFLFLSYEQFQSLSVQEKKLYMTEIRKLNLEFESTLNSLSAANAKWSLLLRIFGEYEATAGTKRIGQNFDNLTADANDEISTTDNRMENAKINNLLDHAQRYLTTYYDSPSPLRLDAAIGKFAQAYDRLNALLSKNLSGEEKKNAQKNLIALKETQQDLQTIDYSLASFHKPIANMLKKVLAKPDVAILMTNDSEAPTAKKEESRSNLPVLKPATTLKSTVSHFTCLYAGFVIKKPKCETPTELPAAFTLVEISKFEFKCEEKKQAMCNPMIFGYKNEKSAYCVEPLSDASKACEDISNNTENQKRIYKIWNNSANKKAYSDYHAELQKICNLSVQKSTDILKTCHIVQAQFNKVMLSELPTAIAKSEVKIPVTDYGARRDQ
ncbi:MAG: hypothetical protein H7061_11945 [Bdellovibrionaceae bacterium]|nr:hypothetical protein [Bdellovibrio sp.]